jgi:hypothetical protein
MLSFPRPYRMKQERMLKQVSRCTNRDYERCLKAWDEVHNYLHNEVKTQGYDHVGDTCDIEFTILCLAVLPHNNHNRKCPVYQAQRCPAGVVQRSVCQRTQPCACPNTCRRND